VSQPPTTGWMSAPRPPVPRPTPPPASPTKREVWLFDTSTLLSLAGVDDLRAVIQAELSSQPCVLFDVVVDELAYLAGRTDATALLARRAQGQLGWLGAVASTATISDVDRALAIQDVIAGTRALAHDWEHWAESVMIDIARRMTQGTPILLSEDHSARVEASQRTPDGEGPIASYSLHKLMARMVRAGRMRAQDAAAFADQLQQAGRARLTYTAQEFSTGNLRRVGQP
jgi:hypothetical protein